MADPLRVLILEDRPADAELMVHELRRAGFEPDWQRAETEPEYVARLDAGVDLILADHTMPQLDAPRALALMRQCNLDIPFIIVSGTISEEAAVACMREGAADYLLKDRLARLGEAARHALEARRLRAEQRRLFQEEQERRRELEAVRHVTVEITRELDLTTLLGLIHRRAMELVGATTGIFFFWDEAAQVLVPTGWHGLGEWVGEVRLRLGEGVAGTVAERRQGMIVPDYRTSPYAYPLFAERARMTAVVAEPLLYRDRLVGVITVYHEEEGKRFTEGHRRILGLFAAQAAIVIENARLHETALRRAQQLATVNELTRTLTTVLDPVEVAQAILAAVQALFPGAAGELWEQAADDGTYSLIASVGMSRPRDGLLHRFLPGEGFAGIAAATRQPVVGRDVRQDPRFLNRAWAAAEGLVSAICLPLLYGEKCNGVLVIFTRSPHDFTGKEVDLLRSFAAQAAIALENARLYWQARRRADEIAALSEAGQAITGSLDLEAALGQVAESARRLSGADRAFVWLVDPQDRSLRAAIASGPGAEGFLGIRLQADSPATAARVAREGRAIAVPDALDPAIADPALSARFGNAAFIAVPLTVRGAVLGVLVVGYNRPRTFDAAEVDRLVGLAQHAAIAIQNARLYEESQRRGREANALADVGRVLNESLEMDRVLDLIVREVQRLLDVPFAGFMTLDEERQELAYAKTAGLNLEIMAGVRLAVGEGFAGHAVAQGAPVQSPNVLEDPRWVDGARAGTQDFRSVLAVPLMIRGRPLGALLVFRQDEHEFASGEVQLLARFADQAAVALENARMYKEVKDARDFLQSIAANSTDGIVTTDVHGRLTYVSPGAQGITGYRAEELLGRPMADYYRGGIEEARTVMRRLRAERRIRNYETTLRAKDGRWVEVSTSMSLLQDARGTTVGTLGVTRDITDRKRAEEQLRQSEKLATMGELLAGVAHELNNPLSVVMGQATLLGMKAGDGPLAAKAKKIMDAAERCGRIVKNFLTLARRRPPERQKVLLNQIVQEAVELLAYPLRVDTVEAALDLAQNLPPLWADPHQLHQVLVNLITNAHHAMHATPPPRRLTLTTRFDPAARRVTLEVADTGPGIPPEVQARVFEPFFTTKPAGEGTGLGLSLCQGIIEGHGGSIQVESQPGAGALFRIELPVETPPPPEAAAPPAQAPPSIRGKTILVVEDEPLIAELLAEILAADGQQVEKAANGLEALEKLQTRAYDVILSDLRMPGMDGPTLYREVARRHPAFRRRFIFVTGDILSAETREFIGQAGAPALAKPFTPDTVRRAVQEALYKD